MSEVSSAQVKVDFGSDIAADRQSPDTGWSSWGLGYAKVVSVYPEDLTIVLKTLGEGATYQREPIRITFPGGGNRSFVGVMPSVGDVAVVGYMAQESSGGSKQPVILGWLPPQPWTGQTWNPTSEMSPEEYDLLSQKSRDEWQGVYDTVRHKSRHMQSGDFLASSAQGADLVLDESASMRNRRGNEVTLRDADQTLVTRAVASHTALGGVREQQGPVTRNARILPRQVVSDGLDWASGLQIDVQGKTVSPQAGTLTSATKADTSGYPAGYLVPAIPLRRAPGSSVNLSGMDLPDPYLLLRQGGLIDAQGYVVKPDFGQAIYGGKPYWRVGQDGEGKVFAEYRVEVQHDHDGTLPVDDQTDGFDHERLEDSRYIEQVSGTVIGNDPKFPDLYGIPLSPQIQGKPGLVSAIGKPLGSQAAMLTRMRTPQPAGHTEDTWWSVTKDGRVMTVIGSPQGQDPSLEMLLRQGAQIQAGGLVQIQATGIDLVSPVSIQGGLVQSGDRVTLEGRKGVTLRSGQSVILSAPTVVMDCASVRHTANTTLGLESGDHMALTSQRLRQVTTGSARYVFGGPDGGSPSGGAVRATTIAPLGVGATATVDSLQVAIGSREERFLAGNSSTETQVGKVSHMSLQGSVEAKAGTNQFVTDSASGMQWQVPTGDASLTTAGQYSATAAVSWHASTTGAASLGGTLGVTLKAPGKAGWIVSGADLDPLSGLPLAALGMGSPGHRIGA